MTDPTGVGGFNLSQEWTTQTAPVLGVQFKEITFRWATVTVSSPLQIQLDGDGLVLPLVPDSLIEADAPPVGARLWVQLFGRRVIVLGVAGGLVPGSLTSLIATVSALGSTVAGHTTSIGTNTSNIATNTSNIASNTSAISTLNGTVSGHTSSISSLNSTVSGHTSTLSSHTSSISSLNSSVSSINGQLGDLPTAMLTGTVFVDSGGTAAGTQSVSFPGGYFSSTPIISLTQAANSQFWFTAINAASSSGFDATIKERDGTARAGNIGCHWIAVQM